MACGDRYRDLLVNANGNSADDACNLYCGFTDYERWRDRARELSVLVSEHWQELARIENGLATNARREALLPQQHALVDDFDRLPTATQAMFQLDELTWDASVARAVSVCRQAVCVLEQVDDAIASYGAAPPPVPTSTKPKPPFKPFSLGSLLLPAFVVGGAIVVVAAATRR